MPSFSKLGIFRFRSVHSTIRKLLPFLTGFFDSYCSFGVFRQFAIRCSAELGLQSWVIDQQLFPVIHQPLLMLERAEDLYSLATRMLIVEGIA